MLPDKIQDKISPEPNTGCWLWTACINTSGYAGLWWDGKKREAHRVVYELAVGPVPAGLQLDHLCRVRSCVNPEHLEPVTPKENVHRGMGTAGIHFRKTHCVNGHKFDELNTRKTKEGWRVCRACKRNREHDR